MNRFAALLDRLAYEPRRNAKLRLLVDYFRHAPDPDRGYALAALTGSLMFKEAKAGLIRGLVEERTDPVLFRMSYNYVGDLAETVALIWPAPGRAASRCRNRGRGPRPQQPAPHVPTITEVVETLATAGKSDLPGRVAGWLDALDETGRWALLKLITRELRVGVSARLAKTAVAQLGGFEPDEVELIWHGLEVPYEDVVRLGRDARAEARIRTIPRRFVRPCCRIRSRKRISRSSRPRDFIGEWKWDGIRLQAVAGHAKDGRSVRRIYSRTGEDVSRAFPDLVEALAFEGAIDGELLIVRNGRVQSFNVLQQRLNRKAVTPKLIADFPVHLRVYDILTEGDEDLRDLPFAERRKRLEALVARLDDPRIELSPIVPFSSWEELAAARTRPGFGRRGPGCGCDRGLHDQARGQSLPSGTSQGLLVQVETRPLPGRRGHDVRAARARKALVVLFRLHLRRLARRPRWRGAGSRGEGLSWLHRRGTGKARPLCAQQHGQPVRPRPGGRVRQGPGSGPRGRVRGIATLDAT